MTLAQNPDELFDVVSADGAPTGRKKRRADVHRDGDWHRSLHIWVYGVDTAGPFVLMQQRGMNKDTQPGMLDPTVSGHLGAGETVEDGFREMEEEIGLPGDPQRMRHIGTRPRAAEGTTPGVVDRELQEVFLYREDCSLEEYRPNAAELEALFKVRLEDAIRLLAGEVGEISAQVLAAHSRETWTGRITAAMFVPAMIDRYFLRVALAIEREIRGERYNVL